MSEDFERTPGGAILMDGNRLRDETVVRLRGEIEALGSPAVCLATVLVGADKPSQIYVRMKQKKAQEAGMVSKGGNSGTNGFPDGESQHKGRLTHCLTAINHSILSSPLQ